MILHEKFPKGKLMIIDREINEDGKKSETLRVTGLFAIADYKNANNRIYSQEVLEKAIAQFQKEIEITGGIFSLDGHPKDGDDLKLSNVSHSIAEVWAEPDSKNFYANLQILPSTAGKNLWAIMSGGGAIGLSMRGQGELRPTMKAGEKVEMVENFVLEGIDTVLNPSFNTARFNKGDLVGESLSTDARLSEVQEAKNWESWIWAKKANYKGSFEDYKEHVLGLYKLTEKEQKMYTYSRIAGAKMSPTEWKKKIVLGM